MQLFSYHKKTTANRQILSDKRPSIPHHL